MILCLSLTKSSLFAHPVSHIPRILMFNLFISCFMFFNWPHRRNVLKFQVPIIDSCLLQTVTGWQMTLVAHVFPYRTRCKSQGTWPLHAVISYIRFMHFYEFWWGTDSLVVSRCLLHGDFIEIRIILISKFTKLSQFWQKFTITSIKLPTLITVSESSLLIINP